jgi:hypothetical protein
MNRWMKLLVVPFLLVFLFAGGAWALDYSLANDITIYDARADSSKDWWDGRNDNRQGSINEDNEVEPDMVGNQNWDLEAFVYSNNELSMVGGFNFIAGYQGLYSGDIFIDITGDAQYGEGASKINGMGYDYVIDVDWEKYDHNRSSGTYEIYSISNTDVFSNATESQNSPESDPWRYVSGGESTGTGTFQFGEFEGDEFLGDASYYVTGFDLSFLSGKAFTSHFTMECGNDNLWDNTTPPNQQPCCSWGPAFWG